MSKAGAPPGISPTDLFDRLQAGEALLLLDVREPYEWTRAFLNLPGLLTAPLSELAARGVEALPDAARDRQAVMVVFCHVGERSRMVTAWLRTQGWSGVLNLEGGIDAYARQVDPRVGVY